MGNIVKRLASFVTRTRFDALPDDVTHETKRIILDSIGCAVRGLSTERGRISVGLASKLGGPAEATVIGTHEKVSCANAAFANGELTNTLDFDALSPTVVHVAPVVVPAALALAEATGVSGKSLILAVALGLEVAARLRPETPSTIRATPEQVVGGGLLRMASPGFSVASLAAAASAGKIIGMDEKKLANAIGIAGTICPPHIMGKFVDTAPAKMTKYGPSGWGAQVGITSALLADMGYTGDIDLFDGEYGFWQYTGRYGCRTAELGKLGAEWLCHQVRYKLYPACGMLSGVLDCLIQIMKENNLGPEHITEIVIYPPPTMQFKLWHENTLRTPDDYPFNALYLVACAAHQVAPAHWHDSEVKQDPGIREFMRRIKFSTMVDEKKVGIEVVAGGKKFSADVTHVKGAATPEEFRLTDAGLVSKFVDNVSGVLPSDMSNQAARTTLKLEDLKNVAQLMAMVAL